MTDGPSSGESWLELQLLLSDFRSVQKVEVQRSGIETRLLVHPKAYSRSTPYRRLGTVGSDQVSLVLQRCCWGAGLPLSRLPYTQRIQSRFAAPASLSGTPHSRHGPHSADDMLLGSAC